MSKRARCEQCNKALVACYCASLSHIDNALSVVILQHPSEVKHARGTAKIVELSLSNIEVFVGEDFTTNEPLNERLNHKKSLLLYPTDDAMTPEQLVKQVQQDNDFSLADYQLVVIDGSWKKAYKIFSLNPILATLPKIGIDVVDQSNYRIRKSSRADSLSTLEAIHTLLSAVEGNKFDGLLTSFNTMIEFQLQSMPEGVKARY